MKSISEAILMTVAEISEHLHGRGLGAGWGLNGPAGIQLS